MEDSLSLWKELGWGNSMWNLHGAFGVFDSERADVQYERLQGTQARPKNAGAGQKILRIAAYGKC
jgi:hypothetical protein